jgi:hypothetical protein
MKDKSSYSSTTLWHLTYNSRFIGYLKGKYFRDFYFFLVLAGKTLNTFGLVISLASVTSSEHKCDKSKTTFGYFQSHSGKD